MKKITQEEFLQRIKEVHGDRYDYSKVEYKTAKDKVCIICHEKDIFGNEHGEFWVRPSNFIGGSRCPKCNKTQWTTENLIAAFKEVHGDRYDYSKVEYKGVREKVCIICNDLDRKGKIIGEFWQYPLIHLNGAGCERERRGSREDCWEERICPICGNKFKARKKYSKITCSEECRKKYVEIHKEEINEKKTKKMSEYYKNLSIEEKNRIKEKIRKTNLIRYGKENFSQTEDGRKLCSMNMKRSKKDYDEKYKVNILIPKYKEICEKDNLELIEFRDRFDCTVKCKKCGNIFQTKTLGYLRESTSTHKCRICYPIEPICGPTSLEVEFENFLKEIKVEYFKNYRSVIYPQEIDFYLPSVRIGFELDGLYWHSEAQKPNSKYHLLKTEKCKSNGVRLIHIFEDEWKYKQEICKSIILGILGKNKEKIGARLCEVREITTRECRNFIENNHIQGFIGFTYGYALFYKGEIVSVMTFGKLRKNMGRNSEDNHYEIIRYCTKNGLNIVGGASKLLTHFIKDKIPKKIITYSDRRWSEGNVYEKLGFTFVHNTLPNYFYVFGDRRKNRFAMRKNVLVEKYDCPKEMTEKEFCFRKGWYRIYDCGSRLYELTPESVEFTD